MTLGLSSLLFQKSASVRIAISITFHLFCRPTQSFYSTLLGRTTSLSLWTSLLGQLCNCVSQFPMCRCHQCQCQGPKQQRQGSISPSWCQVFVLPSGNLLPLQIAWRASAALRSIITLSWSCSLRHFAPKERYSQRRGPSRPYVWVWCIISRWSGSDYL